MRAAKILRHIVLALVLLLAACAGPNPAPAASPRSSPSAQPSARASASPAPSPTPSAGTAVAYGVLAAIDRNTQQFTISIVGVDGHVVASAKGTSAEPTTCRGIGALLPNPAVSTSNSRVYFLDGSTVKYLAPDGKTGSLSNTPAGSANTAVEFAVSPDDSQIAVELTQYSSPVQEFIEVGPVAQQPGVQIYSANMPGSAASVPVGWHAGNLVLAYYPGTCTQGGGPGVGLPLSYHVSSASDAHRIATVGSDAGNCFFGGVPSPAGVVCSDFSSTAATMFDWSGASVHLVPADPQTYSFAVSPDGARVAMCCTAGGGIRVVGIAGAPTVTTDVQRNTFGWIDATHILIGAQGAQEQALVWDIAANKQTPVAAQGEFRGRIPGTLDVGRGTGTGA